MNNWKKKFIIIWSGQLFSILSSSIAQFAIVLWISLETGSAEVLSFATIAALLPQVVLGPFAGVFVDSGAFVSDEYGENFGLWYG